MGAYAEEKRAFLFISEIRTDNSRRLNDVERLKRIARLWPYLPTFRVVAELEHVTRAATVLGITPSAVSRTVAMLEEELGQALFARTGRRIVMNEAGQDLLAAVRDAMRLVDEGVLRAEHRAFVGAIRIAAVEPFLSCLASGTLVRLRARHPGLVPELARAHEQESPRLLETGLADVAFVRQAPRKSELVVTRVASFATAFFVRRDHPLTARAGAQALASEPSIDVSRARDVASPWPPELPRHTAALAADYDVALTACAGVGLLAVLPVAMVEGLERAGLLVRIARPATPAISLYALTRRPVTAPGRAEAVVAAAIDEAAQKALSAGPS
jgi:DNA-binding transcriptional LysR family regulator